MKKISAPLIVSLYVISVLAGSGMTGLYMTGPGRLSELAPFMTLPFIITIIIFPMFVYKIWQVLQDGNPSTTPGAAAGLLFVPLFNIYWLFRAIYFYAKDYNRYISEKQIDVPRLSEQYFLFTCIAALAGPAIGQLTVLEAPLVTVVLNLVPFVMMSVLMGQAIGARNRLVN